MKLRDFAVRSACGVGATFALAGIAWAAPPRWPSASSSASAADPAVLIANVRRESGELSHLARQWDRLTLNADARWRAYDGQWLRIKPVSRDIGRNLNALRAQGPELTRSQRKRVQLSIMIYGRIRATVQDLRSLLNDPGVTRTNPGFGYDSMRLARQSRLLARTL